MDIFNSNEYKCYITIQVGENDVMTEGRILSASGNGLWISYKYNGKEYTFVHGFATDDNGQVTDKKERFLRGRPHFLLPFGSASDCDWKTGIPTAKANVISTLAKSQIAVDAIKAVTGNKSGLNLKKAIIGIVIVVIIGIVGYSLYQNSTKSTEENIPTLPNSPVMPK